MSAAPSLATSGPMGPIGRSAWRSSKRSLPACVGQGGIGASSPRADKTLPASVGTMLQASTADSRTRFSAVRVTDRGARGIGIDRGPGRRLLHIGVGARPDRARLRRGVAELQRFVMRPQLRDAPVDLGCQRVLARARRSPARHAAVEGLRGETERGG